MPKKKKQSKKDKLKQLIAHTKLPRTRKKAQKLKINKYFTGKRCKKGHLAARYTQSGVCVNCRVTANGVRRRNSEVVHRYNTSAKGKAASERWRKKHVRRYWASKVRQSAKSRARKRDLPFDISREYVESIMPDECPVFGVPLDYSMKCKDRDNAPSLDRIIPELGYTKGNIVVISLRANQIKNKYRSRDIYKVAIWLKKLGL